MSFRVTSAAEELQIFGRLHTVSGLKHSELCYVQGV